MLAIATSCPLDESLITDSLVAVGRALARLGYHFSTTTPATHRWQNGRPEHAVAQSLRDVFGWSRPFEPSSLPAGMFDLLKAGKACEPVPGSALWRALVRFASLDGLLFAHSAFPTSAPDAVFFGPDSVRFVRAIKHRSVRAARIVDVGCGSGVGGIMLQKWAPHVAEVVLTDINPNALRLARVNAELAGVRAEFVHADLFRGVSGDFDLIIANPPYLCDAAHRAYRDGGGSYGEGVSTRIVREGVRRLAETPNGGTLLLYTGAAIVNGTDTFFDDVRGCLADFNAQVSYEELDPDVFSEELELCVYADVERIAAVFLEARVTARRSPSPPA